MTPFLAYWLPALPEGSGGPDGGSPASTDQDISSGLGVG